MGKRKRSSEIVIEVLLGEESGSLSEAPSSSVERKATLLVAFFVLLVSFALSLSFEFFTSDSIERLEAPSHVSSTHWSASWLI